VWSVCKGQAIKVLSVKCVQIDKVELTVFSVFFYTLECTFYFTPLYILEDWA